MRSRVALLVVSVVLVTSRQATQLNSQNRLHPGNIVDAGSRKGIAADAYAYGSQTPASETGCPTYPDLLDDQHSSADTGSFALHIPKEKSGYLAVYCKTGYASRTETVNDNSRDHTRVQPDPITLFPMGASDDARTQIATNAIITELIRLHSHLSYYNKSSPQAFTAARESSRFSNEDREAITVFMKDRKYSTIAVQPEQDSWKFQKDIPDHFVAYAAMAHDLNAARADLRYYADADKKAYSTALLTNFSDQKDALEAIRNRRDPFESPE